MEHPKRTSQQTSSSSNRATTSSGQSAVVNPLLSNNPPPPREPGPDEGGGWDEDMIATFGPRPNDLYEDPTYGLLLPEHHNLRHMNIHLPKDPKYDIKFNPPNRPGYNTSGLAIKVALNSHLVSTIPDKKIQQYDVSHSFPADLFSGAGALTML